MGLDSQTNTRAFAQTDRHTDRQARGAVWFLQEKDGESESVSRMTAG